MRSDVSVKCINKVKHRLYKFILINSILGTYEWMLVNGIIPIFK